MTGICALMTIVDKGASQAVQGLYQQHQMHVSLVLRGHGTANSEVMDLLGLDEPEKELILGIAHRGRCRSILREMAEKLHLDRPGTGVAFTCPLTGITVAASGRLHAEIEWMAEDKEEEPMASQPMEMIVMVVDSGSTDLVVSAAKTAGAHGGTVLKAREVAGEEKRKIFGITVEPEKELVLMVVPSAEKKGIFKAVCAAVLEQTGEHAFGFSLPVSDAVGLKL